MKKHLFIFGALLLFCARGAFATDVYLSLSAHGQRMELGLSGFIPDTQMLDESKAAREIEDVLRSDLLFSRYFNLVEEGPLYTGKDEELVEWTDRGATTLITGAVRVRDTALTLKAQLMDVESKQVMWQKEYTGTVGDVRRLAHELNDDIVYRFTGEKGLAHTKIAFANNASGRKEIYLADYDGANVRRLTNDSSINILPRWSPSGDELLYTTYRYGNPDLYALSPLGGFKRPVSRLQGLNTAATFTPDGQQIALTISQGGSPNLCLLSKSGKLVKKLTNSPYIETSPSFAPNGREIIYISDKPGLPQMFIMNLEGGNVRRLTTNGYCDSPAWSPRGDKIVFSMRLARDNFDIYVYDLTSDRISRLTQDEGSNENPSWSPDGRFIVFSSTRSGHSQLYVIAVDGSGVRRVGDIPGSSYTPSWSP